MGECWPSSKFGSGSPSTPVHSGTLFEASGGPARPGFRGSPGRFRPRPGGGGVAGGPWAGFQVLERPDPRGSAGQISNLGRLPLRASAFLHQV